ncbi:MAG: two-component regulator propeller domain-containing protein [Candidatus Acidiferrum sp.]
MLGTRAIVGCVLLVMVLASGLGTYALDPALDVSQYAHTAWTVRDGFSLGNIYAMTQTPDGYLWLGTEFGLLRFDGTRSISWQPPAGQHLPDKAITALLVTRDGTLWIGTAIGLATWSGGKLTRRPELGAEFVASLFEDREGTVWASSLGTPNGRLCALRSSGAQCYGEDGAFGRAVWALYEDNSGTLWAGAQSGLWRMKPGSARRYATPTELIGLSKTDDGHLLIAMHSAGLMQLVDDNVEPYPIRSAIISSRLLSDRDVDANRVVRDRDGGLWIGTVERGLIHVHHGRTDVFSRTNGLSGDVVLSLFEDREGNVWVATTGGLDRFRDLPVTTISVKQGLSSDATQSVLAATDGSIWVGAHEGLTRWKNGQTTIFGKASGLPDDAPQSMFQDDRGRIWVFTGHGLAYFKGGRFLAVNGLLGCRVHFITGDKAGNLWLSEEKSLLHLLEGRLVEQIPWSVLGRKQRAQALLSDPEHGGVWLAFWQGGGLLYFKDRQPHVSYSAANGLGEGAVGDIQLDRDGTLWAATQTGVSRLKDGRIATLTSKNGLPCDTIHWTIEDDDRSLWLYTECGLVRIVRTELDAWIADPMRRIETTVWDATDGVRLRATAASEYGPRVAKASDGKLWFVTGEGVQIVEPRHLAVNKVPPPVRIEQIIADDKIHWQNLTGDAVISNLRLPPRIRDLQIDYTALSLVAPEKVHFKYKLEGQDDDWREVVNDRHVQYSNLHPGTYRFRVIACNNSGVWNEQGDTLEFSVAPAYWQTNWFRVLCVLVFLAILWAAHRFRVHVLEERQALLERQQALLELHEGEISALNERLMKAQEEERIRIAGELHDGVLQKITSLALELATATMELPGDSEPKADVREVEKKLIEVGTEIRQLSHELHPAVLQEAGLPAALSSYCEEFSKLRGIPVSYGADRSVEELSPGAALCIYRIAQEALGNVAKHAQAKQVQVRLTRSDGRVCLVVSDDGVGFNPDGSGKAGGLGLINMRERVRQLNWTFEFESKPGHGTTVKAEVPFRPAPQASDIRSIAGRRWM